MSSFRFLGVDDKPSLLSMRIWLVQEGACVGEAIVIAESAERAKAVAAAAGLTMDEYAVATVMGSPEPGHFMEPTLLLKGESPYMPGPDGN